MTRDEAKAKAAALNAWIENERIRTGASEVRLHHVPRWLWTALKPIRSRIRGRYADRTIHDVLRGPDEHWLDHWGSTKVDGASLFVSEPYGLSVAASAHVDSIAKACGLVAGVSSISWWYPGSTTRVWFRLADVNERAGLR